VVSTSPLQRTGALLNTVTLSKSYAGLLLSLQLYTINSILFIVFITLIIVAVSITVSLTYFQLAVEDHRWGAHACVVAQEVYRPRWQTSAHHVPSL
jgi:hypothetical protein